MTVLDNVSCCEREMVHLLCNIAPLIFFPRRGTTTTSSSYFSNKLPKNPRYGLGQTYELLNFYNYALYYYRQALQLRPLDSRVWIALANCFLFLNRRPESIRCFERAFVYGDAEGLALPRLARLYAEDPGSHDLAAEYYRLLLKQPVSGVYVVAADTAEALRFLMFWNRARLEGAGADGRARLESSEQEAAMAECVSSAHQLMEFCNGKDEAKAVLKGLGMGG